MSFYSINPEISTKPSGENIPDDDWESKMARLVGFAEESTDVTVEEISLDEDSEEFELSIPQQIPREQSLSSNPFAKLALVGGATFTVILVAGGVLSQIMSVGSQKSRTNVTPATTPATAITQPQKPLAEEVEILKTKLALAEQDQAVIAAQQTLRNPVNIPSTEMQTSQPLAQVTTTKPVQTAPKVVTVERIIEKPVVVEKAPSPESVAAPPPPAPPTTVISKTTHSAPDPWQQWTRLAKLGSYGEVYTTGKSALVPIKTNNIRNQNPQSTAEAKLEELPPEEELISLGETQNHKSVKIGTTIKGVLATAVFGETTRTRNNNSNDGDNNGNVFVVQLREPLKYTDGAIALPVNTELLAEVSSISEKGLLQLKVVKLVTVNQDQLVETPLPENAIIIRAPQGKPLMADKFPNQSSSIARMDAGLFVLGGISEAAKLFNRAETEISIDGGNTIVSNSNNRRNIPAGILEGGLRSLVPQISQRNQQSISQMMEQTNVWYLPAGREVEIYVNRMMEF